MTPLKGKMTATGGWLPAEWAKLMGAEPKMLGAGQQRARGQA